MPFNKEPLSERVEKERKSDEHFDLETADLTKLFKHKKSAKKENKKGTKNK